MKRILLYDSPISSLSGYGEHAREVFNYINSLKDKYDIYLIDAEWGNTECCYDFTNTDITTLLKKKIDPVILQKIHLYIKLGLPSEFSKIGKHNIGITALVESTKSSDLFIQKIKEMDSVIVPSSFNKNTILNSDSTVTNVDVIPQCLSTPCNSDEKRISKLLDTVSEDFCFLINSKWNLDVHQQFDRKNVESQINLLLHTFKDSPGNPALILKTFSQNYSKLDYIKICDKLKEIKSQLNSNTNIYLLHGNLTESEIKGLYTHPKVKCTLNVTHGESFGRTAFESVLYKKPTLIPNWSAPIEYLKNSMFHVNGKLIKHPVYEDLLVNDGEWYDPDIDNFSEKIVDIYNNIEKYNLEIVKESNKIKETHNKKTIGNKYKRIIEAYL